MNCPQLTRAACLLAIFAAVVTLIVYVVGAADEFIRDDGLHADFRAFFHAAEQARGGGDLYAPWNGPPYIYPPLFASLLAPLVPIGPLALSLGWTVVSAGLVGAAACLSAIAVARATGGSRGLLLALAPGAVGLLLVSDRLKSMLRMGQTDSVILFGVALALWALPRHPVLVGLGIGLGANFKYLTLAFIPWLVVRRRWRELGWTAFFTVLFALVPSLILGWERNLANLAQGLGSVTRALGVVSADGPRGPSLGHYENVSVPEGIFRMLGGQPADRTAAFAYTAAIVAGLIAVVWMFYRRAGRPLIAQPRGQDPGREVVIACEWCCVWLAALSLSPGICTRHLIMLIPVLAMAVSMWWEHWPRGPSWAVLGAVVFMMACWTRVPVLWHDDPKAFARVIGLAGWGGIPLILALAWAAVRWRPPDQASVNSPPGG